MENNTERKAHWAVTHLQMDAERVEELNALIQEWCMYQLLHAEDPTKSSDVTKALELAKDMNEAAYVAYQIGMATGRSMELQKGPLGAIAQFMHVVNKPAPEGAE